MRKTFNCGLRGILAVSENVAEETITKLAAAGERPKVIGKLVEAYKKWPARN